jgi:hypothetical protein
MPYKSLAQARKFHADPKLRRYAAEFDAATDFSKLPRRLHPANKGRSLRLSEINQHAAKKRLRRRRKR